MHLVSIIMNLVSHLNWSHGLEFRQLGLDKCNEISINIFQCVHIKYIYVYIQNHKTETVMCSKRTKKKKKKKIHVMPENRLKFYHIHYVCVNEWIHNIRINIKHTKQICWSVLFCFPIHSNSNDAVYVWLARAICHTAILDDTYRIRCRVFGLEWMFWCCFEMEFIYSPLVSTTWYWMNYHSDRSCYNSNRTANM